MTTASEHAEIVLSAIIPGRSDLMDRAHAKLVPDHFIDTTTRTFFELVVRYYETVAKVMPREVLSDLLRNRDPSKVILFEELYDSLAERQVDDSDFTWSMEQLRELAAERATQEAFTKGMEILRVGVQEGQARKQGQADAWAYVTEARAAIDRDLAMQESPEGDTTLERDEIWNDYQERRRMRESGLSQGLRFGIPVVDSVITGGVQPGEFVVVAGGSSSGKTATMIQIAWQAKMDGKNILFFTTETLREQVRRRLMSRHSKHPMFEIPEGLNSRALREGTLSDAEEEKLGEVIDDYTKNPAYGHVYVAQLARHANVAAMEAQLYRIQRTLHIDGVIMDYNAMLKPNTKRNTRREEMADNIMDSAQLAKTFDNGRGVPYFTPWQITRDDQKEAERTGQYDMNSLAETAEITNSADIAISWLGLGSPDSRYRELKGQVLKNRDGERDSSMSVRVDYATSTFTDFANQARGSHGILDDDDDEDFYSGLLK